MLRFWAEQELGLLLLEISRFLGLHIPSLRKLGGPYSNPQSKGHQYCFVPLLQVTQS